MYFRVCGTAFILYLLWWPEWQRGEVPLQEAVGPTSRGFFRGHLAIRIGLQGAEIHLEGNLKGPEVAVPIHYRKSFTWDQGEECLRAGLHQGLPFPILTALEYFRPEDPPFWGNRLQMAGHIATILLWCGLVLCCMSNVIALVEQQHQSHIFLLLGGGVLLMAASLCYHLCLIRTQQHLAIPFQSNWLLLHYGSAFYGAILMGALCLLVSGKVIASSSLCGHHTWYYSESTRPSTILRQAG